ncbi:MAG TPA: RsbRD N-terminal domain-containing protein, partial [Telluria sp.]
MRLADFIRANIEPIVEKWEEFALGAIAPARALDRTALRDHAKEMLLTIAADLDQAQTEQQRSEKAKGRGRKQAEETAAEAHGIGRLTAGFDVNETISEYRAFRASIVALWTETDETVQATDFADILRFNEAIDQALTESVAAYTLEKEKQARL